MSSEPVHGPLDFLTVCIAGLGNPGSRYAESPHNMGFRILDVLARRHSIKTIPEGGALAGAGKIQGKEVVLVKPQTFMNLSGSAIRPILKARRLTYRDLVVVYDELDLPWTALRIKRSGSAAEHNGVKSIIAALETDTFTRVRVGIRPDHPIGDAAEYVLAPLEPELRGSVDEVVSYAADAIESIVADGAVTAMAKFNRRALGTKEEEE